MCKKQIIPSVNFHLWKPCNMRCKFCFATFEDSINYFQKAMEVNKKECFEIIKQLAENSIQKITFVGGEPMLCPWIEDVLSFAKSLGLTTMIVTNGSKLSMEWIKTNHKNCDWITISIDSINKNTNLISGRAIGGKKPLSENDYFHMTNLIKNHGVRLKLNTTVSAFNWKEDMSKFILTAKPERWKIFQALPIIGQNDKNFHKCKIRIDQFDAFVKRHLSVQHHTEMIAENNDAMTESYLMIDPAGRFFDNSRGRYFYSRAICDVGWKKALSDIQFDYNKFIARKGIYDWS